jgi:hypothetical protein
MLERRADLEPGLTIVLGLPELAPANLNRTVECLPIEHRRDMHGSSDFEWVR